MLARLRSALARLRELPFASRIAGERDEEFRFHLEMEIEHHRRAGMSDAEARRAAALAFGGRERFRDEVRDARGIVVIDNLLRDTRFALRRMRRAPAFALGVIATLGVGIGAAVGIGTMVYGVLLRDLPYKHSESLVRVSFLTPGLATTDDLNSEATYVHFASASQSFEGFGAYYTNDAMNLVVGEEAERIAAGMVTPGTFHLLGVAPILGQLFAPEDTAWTGNSIPVLISEELWRRRFGSDPAIIGRKIELNRGARRVIGVLPRAFDFPSPDVRVWYPASIDLGRPQIAERYYNVIARLKSGVSTTVAQAELEAMIPSLPARFPAITRELLKRSAARVTLQSLKAATIAPVRGQLVVLGMMVCVVLLVATTNVVNLFLLRAERATPEIAIALSLGATRAAIAQRFAIEGMVLGAASIIVALPVAAAALTTRFGFGSREMPRLHEVAFGADTLAVVGVAGLAIGAAVGLTALTRAGGGIGRLGDRLRGTTRVTASPAWRRVQRGLVATQIALALALLVAAGLLGRSFANLRKARLGFEPSNTMTLEVALPFQGYVSYAEGAAFHARVLDRFRALPGVGEASAAMRLPLATSNAPEMSLRIEPVDAARTVVSASANLAAPDYFDVMRIPIVRGRSFGTGDLRGDAPAVMLSATLARVLFGTENPVGRLIRRAPDAHTRPATFRVIGVAGDVHGARIENGPDAMIYFPLLRDGDGVSNDSLRVPFRPRGAKYVLRGTTLPSAQTIRRLIHEVDPRVPAVGIQPLDAFVDAATARVRLTLLLLGVAGSAALLLGVIGVYSVASYAAAGRVREFGVRIALGATPWRVASVVLNEGGLVAAFGIAAGLGAAWAGTRFLSSLLFEVSATSAPEFALAALVLIAVTLLATMIPARRASLTDPAVVLRGE